MSSLVEMIGTALVIWCVFWVPLIAIVRYRAQQPVRPDWEACTKARDQQYRDRINTVPESYTEALDLIANDRTEGLGRELTVEDLCRLHEGLSIPGEK